MSEASTSRRQSERSDEKPVTLMSGRSRLRLTILASSALIIGGNFPLQLVLYAEYRATPAIDIVKVAALAYAAASALALGLLYVRRLVGSAVVVVLIGSSVLYTMHSEGWPFSIVLAAVFVAAGVISAIGTAFNESKAV